MCVVNNHCGLWQLSVVCLYHVLSVQVTVPEEHLGAVLRDLSSLRRAQIHEVLVRQDARLVCAHIPLASLVVRGTCIIQGSYYPA